MQEFRLLAEYKPDVFANNPQPIISHAVVGKVRDYIENDRIELLPLRVGSRFIINLAGAGLVDGFTIGKIPEIRRGPFLLINEFVSRVQARAARYIRLHDDLNWNEEKIRSLAETLADQYRDDYFRYPSAL
ncbi:MAG: hypothetical protein FGM62_02510 [Methylobacterium sp.]|nr:hypothetical protein [Methylobacterium sp.]